jgi:hypothetical protein
MAMTITRGAFSRERRSRWMMLLRSTCTCTRSFTA